MDEVKMLRTDAQAMANWSEFFAEWAQKHTRSAQKYPDMAQHLTDWAQCLAEIAQKFDDYAAKLKKQADELELEKLNKWQDKMITDKQAGPEMHLLDGIAAIDRLGLPKDITKGEIQDGTLLLSLFDWQQKQIDDLERRISLLTKQEPK